MESAISFGWYVDFEKGVQLPPTSSFSEDGKLTLSRYLPFVPFSQAYHKKNVRGKDCGMFFFNCEDQTHTHRASLPPVSY